MGHLLAVLARGGGLRRVVSRHAPAWRAPVLR